MIIIMFAACCVQRLSYKDVKNSQTSLNCYSFQCSHIVLYYYIIQYFIYTETYLKVPQVINFMQPQLEKHHRMYLTFLDYQKHQSTDFESYPQDSQMQVSRAAFILYYNGEMFRINEWFHLESKMIYHLHLNQH